MIENCTNRRPDPFWRSFTEIARLLRNTLESIATPCSVKTETRLENLGFEDVTICDKRSSMVREKKHSEQV